MINSQEAVAFDFLIYKEESLTFVSDISAISVYKEVGNNRPLERMTSFARSFRKHLALIPTSQIKRR